MTLSGYLHVHVVLLLTASVPDFVSPDESIPVNSRDDYPAGDPRRCYSPRNKGLLRLEVIPGGGWDNLRNKDGAMVMKLNYSKCLTTDDGRYLVPDGVYTLPRKSSKVDTYAELFTHWNNYTATLFSSINIHAGLSLGKFGASGKFTDEYESVKSRQFFDKSVTTRVQIRYVRYTAKTEPDIVLNDAFKTRLRRIAAHIEMNRTAHATYESQLIVRDFGTHVITSIDIGAALVQVDQIKEDFVRKSEQEKHSVQASASASFFGIFSAGFDYGHSTSKTLIDEYRRNRTTSHVAAYGGDIFRPGNYTSLNWSISLDNELVALDVSGDPIFYLVSTTALPDLPQSTVYDVHGYIKTAVETYYQHNTYMGCTDRDSPNFSFMANQDDGTCKPPSTNYTFGGVYQTCTGSGYTDLCAGMKQTNPQTGSYSCPDEYEAILLQDGSKHSTTTRHECHRCWIFFHCCKNNRYSASASYSAYWCASKGHVDQNHGYLFGGLYTLHSFNPMTHSANCPSRFYPLRLLSSLVICVSDDYELGLKDSLPFAGFFSCKSGNPLSLQISSNSTLLESAENQHSLMSYMINQGSSLWPRECPRGFSQHLAIVDNGCEINYCIKAGALTTQGLPKVKRPPFMPLPLNIYQTDDPAYAFNDDGTVWKSLEKAEFPGSTTTASNANKSSKSESLSITSIALIVIVSVLTTIIIILIGWAIYKKRKVALYRLRDPWDQKMARSDTSLLSADNRGGSYSGYQDTMTDTTT